MKSRLSYARFKAWATRRWATVSTHTNPELWSVIPGICAAMPVRTSLTRKNTIRNAPKSQARPKHTLHPDLRWQDTNKTGDTKSNMASLYAVLQGAQEPKMTFRFRLRFHGRDPMMHKTWVKKVQDISKSQALQISSSQHVLRDEVD